MAVKITRLDKRHKGLGRFQFYARAQNLNQFLEWRDWAFETLGNGIERDFASKRPNLTWGWLSDDGRDLRIYFQSTRELNWFVLRWNE